MNPNALILQRAAKAFNTTEDNIEIVNRLMGGMSHLTYHIKYQDVDYTFRIIGKDGNLFVDRKIELENLNRIKPLGINNETVFFDVETGEKAAKYVEGDVLTTLDINNHLEDVVSLLKTLHQSDIKPAGDYGLIERLDLYESFTHENKPLYNELKKKWIDIYVNERKDMPKVFCHNDAQRSNMVMIDQPYLFWLLLDAIVMLGTYDKI